MPDRASNCPSLPLRCHVPGASRTSVPIRFVRRQTRNQETNSNVLRETRAGDGSVLDLASCRRRLCPSVAMHEGSQGIPAALPSVGHQTLRRLGRHHSPGRVIAQWVTGADASVHRQCVDPARRGSRPARPITPDGRYDQPAGRSGQPSPNGEHSPPVRSDSATLERESLRDLFTETWAEQEIPKNRERRRPRHKGVTTSEGRRRAHAYLFWRHHHALVCRHALVPTTGNLVHFSTAQSLVRSASDTPLRYVALRARNSCNCAGARRPPTTTEPIRCTKTRKHARDSRGMHQPPTPRNA